MMSTKLNLADEWELRVLRETGEAIGDLSRSILAAQKAQYEQNTL
jgi:hypothetical protein